MVPATAAAEHPALVFDPGDVGAMQTRIADGEPAQWYASVRAVADAGLQYGGDDETQRSRHAMALAFAHLMEGDPAHRARAVEFLLAAGSTDTDWNEFGWNWAESLSNYALAFDWIAPALTPTELASVTAALTAAADKTWAVFVVPPLHTDPFAYWANVRLRIAGGLGLLQLALADDPESAMRVDAILGDIFGDSSEVPHQLHSLLARDGFYMEGANYQTDSFTLLLPWLLALEHSTGVNWLAGGTLDDDRMALAYRASIEMMMPGGYAPTIDTGFYDTIDDHELVAHALAEPGLSMWYWNEVAERHVRNPALAIVFYDPALDAMATPPAFTSVVREQFAALRSGWLDTDRWVLVLGGDAPCRSIHDQPDQTAITMVAGGAYLLIDPGDGRHYPDAEHAWVRRSPQAHNLVIIDGAAGPINQAPATPTKVWRYPSDPDPVADPAPITAAFVDPAVDYVEVRIDAYTDAPSVATRRSVLFPGREYLVVLDEMTASEVHSYDHLLHYGGPLSGAHVDGTLTLGDGTAHWSTTNDAGQAVGLGITYVMPAVEIESHTGPTDWSSTQFDHTYTSARATGANVGFFTVLTPEVAGAEPIVTTGPQGATVTRGATVDRHAVAAPDTTSAEHEGLQVEGRHGYVRAGPDATPAVAMLLRGTSLRDGETAWITAELPCTVMIDRTTPGHLHGQIVADAPFELGLRVEDEVAEVRLGGAAIEFTQVAGELSIAIDGSGPLEIDFGSGVDGGSEDAAGSSGAADGGTSGGHGSAGDTGSTPTGGGPSADDPASVGCGCAATHRSASVWFGLVLPSLRRRRSRVRVAPGR